MRMWSDMTRGDGRVENDDGMKLEQQENSHKNPKIPTLITTITPLATPRVELGTPVGTNEQMGKGISIIGHKDPRGIWMQGSTYRQPRHYEEAGWLIPTLGRLYPRGRPRYEFYWRLSGPQDQSGHEGAKKNLHPCNTRDRTRLIKPVAKHLAAWATWSIRRTDSKV